MPEASKPATLLPFELLCQKLKRQFPNIAAARSEAETTKVKLNASLSAIKLPDTASLVVFGSLARREWTSESDVDWTMLVNGPSDPEHFRLAIWIGDLIRERFREPGRTQTFGTLTSSHELVHHIGGDEDTNKNLTRRILLLLESCSLNDNQERERVIRAVLQRYIVCGPGVPDTSDLRFTLPRFLLNDIVRLWRTFAVDYAAKKWQRADIGWALRNAKLRIPRKLTFAKGLLMCLDCELLNSESPWKERGKPTVGTIEEQLVSGIAELVSLSPIDMISRVFLSFDSKATAEQLLSAYDQYLGMINDSTKRKHLDTAVDFQNALQDEIFAEVRDISHKFGSALETLFFSENDRLRKLTQRYGVF
jgi:hypothetical protein